MILIFYTFDTSDTAAKFLCIPIPMAELGDFLLGSIEGDVRTLLHKIIHLIITKHRPICLG